ncbi:ABC1-domain-containing protein [Rozella allomycis CSF55]|uniref:ABC1-domain-containing protein n=1 Tax=Rozella allomycis (strain CSF55) TaxID=988480 RepID=A0A4P9YGI6_ROZAC|nr:ABC1-domain-containing protein [Rozella allomycis CSF55]
MQRWQKRLLSTVALGSTIYLIDKYINHSVLERSTRTLYNALVIAADYKLNYDENNLESASKLHSRVSQRMFNVCIKNGGLYIKFGQQIASVDVLPAQYHIFRKLYDDAPSVDYDEVKKLFLEETGKEPLEMFTSFSENAIASASIAQVHKATLPDGTEVAVKVQKPQIASQLNWDLRIHRVVLWLQEMLFDIPLVWMTDYLHEHFRQETNFINEGRNAERAAMDLAKVNDLAEKVYIPKVYWEYTTPRILTCEWIDGTKFNALDDLKLKRFNLTDLMKTCVDVFANQIFKTGFIHADPHPGNILVRWNPKNSEKYQLVLLDHGLYVQSTESFRRDYCLFWKSLFTYDIDSLQSVATKWGIGNVQLFASVTLQKPWKPGKSLLINSKSNAPEVAEMASMMKQKLKSFLTTSELLPKELIFVGRNLNLVRSNNRLYGSPVNRIQIMAIHAVEGLGNDWKIWMPWRKEIIENDRPDQWIDWIVARINYSIFNCSLFLASISFYVNRIWQNLSKLITGKEGEGFEAIIDQRIKEASGQFGIQIEASAFDG